MGILLLSPGSCCTQTFVCALQESVSPVLWRFCNHIPLASMSPGMHKILFEPSKCLWQVWGLFLNTILCLVQSCWGFFALGYGVSFFFGGIQHSLVHGYSAESCNFGVLSGEDELRSLYFTIPLKYLGHILVDAQGWVAALSVQADEHIKQCFHVQGTLIAPGPIQEQLLQLLESHLGWHGAIWPIPNVLASRGPLGQSIRDWEEEGRLFLCNIFFIDSF